MKILQYIPSLHTGGAEALVKDYTILYNSQDDCEIVCVVRGESISANELQLQIKNKKILYIADIYPYEKNYIFKIFNFMKRRKWLFRHLEKEKFDVLHTHLSINKYLLFPGRHMRNVKLFHTVHNEPKECFDVGFKEKVEKKCIQYLIKKKNMRLIALHEEMRLELNEMFGVNNTIVLNNGIDMERFNPERYKKESVLFKESLGFRSEDFVVGHIGRLHEQKNHKFLLEVFSHLCKEKENAKLLLVGAGPLKENVCKQIQDLNLTDRVVMLENRLDIPELLSVMDVFLFPSLYEGLGIVLIEAQAMGIRCVVSDAVPSAAHVTSRYKSLSLGEPVEKWSEAVLNENVSTVPTMSLKDYDMREVVKKLEKIYRGEL